MLYICDEDKGDKMGQKYIVKLKGSKYIPRHGTHMYTLHTLDYQ
jgi:hypothetical protein